MLVESGRVLECVDGAVGALESQLEVMNILDMSPKGVYGGKIHYAECTMLTVWVPKTEKKL